MQIKFLRAKKSRGSSAGSHSGSILDPLDTGYQIYLFGSAAIEMDLGPKVRRKPCFSYVILILNLRSRDCIIFSGILFISIASVHN